MEKILFVTNALKLNTQHLEFACFLSNLAGSRLTGIFLENAEKEAAAWGAIGQIAAAAVVPAALAMETKDAVCRENMARFREFCKEKGVHCSTHRTRGLPVHEVISESRYADLIITSPEITFRDGRETIPTRFARSVLRGAECPVVIAPESFTGINEIIFTYDESRSSVYAIRQFTYLFPELCDRKAVIFTVKEPGKPLTNDRFKLKEWLKTHYNSVSLVTEEDRNIRECLLERLLGKKNSFIVMGAFGRNMLSGLFSSSHASQVVKYASQPVFITHC